MTRFSLVLLVSVASAAGAVGQVSAVTEDGRSVVLYEDHVWADSASVMSGLRMGEPVRSATGRFVVHVPDGWTSEPPTGEMLQGEILFRNRADSTYFSPQFVADSLGYGVTPQQFVDSFVAEMAPGPQYGTEAGPLRVEVIDGHRVLSRRISPLAGTGFWTEQISVIAAPGGFVMVIGVFPPGQDGNHQTLLRSIEVLE